MRRFAPILLTMLLLVPGSPAYTNDGTTTLNVTAHAEREVENDLMTVWLSAERRASDLTRAVAEVNTLMRSALERAASEPSVHSRSLSYTTSPVYHRDRTRPDPVAWQVIQQIELKSQNFQTLTRLLAELQGDELAIAQVQFSVSPEARALHEQELLLEAIRRWQRLAQDMGTSIGASHLFPKELTLMDQGFHGPFPLYAAQHSMDVAFNPLPALEAGRSTLRIGVSGQMRAYGAATLRSLERR